MRKKIILRLSVLIVFLTVLWSCHNEDFAKGEAEPQRNNANFFKHTQKGVINAKSGVDYISILEAYNREKDFLTTMPDQEGMPIWDKMRIVKTENSTSLVVPLSEDNATMSSVFFALIDNKENTVKAINNITNDELRRVVFDPTIDVQKRESLFYTFMATDNYTFGNEVFTNIPQDLFADDKLGEQNNRIVFHAPRFGDALATETTTQNGRVQVVYEVICVVIRHCTHHGGGSCDGCSQCKTESCSHSTTLVFTYPDPETGVVIYGYPEGGGGGGTPLPIPDPDPCGLSRAFYRLAPNCNGSTPVILPQNPCTKAKPSIDKINNVLQSPIGQQKIKQILENKASDNVEWGVAIGQNSATGEYEVTNTVSGTASSVPPPFNQLQNSTAIGSAHSHAGTPANPSAGDMFSLLERMVGSNNNITFNLVYGISNGNNETYALIITDPAAAAQFLTDYPRSENYDTVTHGLKSGTELDDQYTKMKIIYNNPNTRINNTGESYNPSAIAMAHVFKYFNSGISLAKVDSNGNFKKINTSLEKTTGNINEIAKVTKCP